MKDGDHSPVDAALDLVVYAPIGVALFARDTVPTFVKMFVARGRTEIDHRRRDVEQQIHQARTIGQFAMRFGGPEVRRRVEDGVATARARAEEAFAGFVVGRDTGPAERPSATATATASGGPAAGGGTAVTNGNGQVSHGGTAAAAGGPPAAALAIPDYDALSASQVVERLEGLSAADLERVRAYESTHRSRRTILGKIAQLTT